MSYIPAITAITAKYAEAAYLHSLCSEYMNSIRTICAKTVKTAYRSALPFKTKTAHSICDSNTYRSRVRRSKSAPSRNATRTTANSRSAKRAGFGSPAKP